MAIILYNGAEVPTNSDDYALTEDLAKMCLSLNIPVPVNNQAERDGLTALLGGPLKVGTMVLRKDQSLFIEKWDGSSWKTSGHSEWTSSQTVPNASVWGTAAMAQDPDQTTDTAFVTHPAADKLRFRDAGTYAITFTATASASLNGRSFVQIMAGAEPLIRTVATGEDRAAAVIPNFRAAANQELTFNMLHNSGADRSVGFRIRITRIG